MQRCGSGLGPGLFGSLRMCSHSGASSCKDLGRWGRSSAVVWAQSFGGSWLWRAAEWFVLGWKSLTPRKEKGTGTDKDAAHYTGIPSSHLSSVVGHCQNHRDAAVDRTVAPNPAPSCSAKALRGVSSRPALESHLYEQRKRHILIAGYPSKHPETCFCCKRNTVTDCYTYT